MSLIVAGRLASGARLAAAGRRMGAAG